MKTVIRHLLSRFGYSISRLERNANIPIDCEHYSELLKVILERKLTMVSPERLAATALACEYVIRESIPGDFVECGVWRGGNSILANEVFRKLNAVDRNVWLFDTFSGMSEPSERDRRVNSKVLAFEQFTQQRSEKGGSEWCRSEIDEVRSNFRMFNSDLERVKFVSGDVNKTLKDKKYIPKQISILRLDTDWYESTRIELETLYPRLSIGGVLIIDDYGHWDGARKAVDEFFSDKKRPLFSITDYTGRMGIKL